MYLYIVCSDLDRENGLWTVVHQEVPITDYLKDKVQVKGHAILLS